MAEYWDVYDENRLPTGRLHQRGIPLAAGDYHLVVRGWILDDQGYLLLSRRDPAKPFGGYWECTGGSVTAGEDSFAGVRREIAEEVGIDVSSAACISSGVYSGRNLFWTAGSFSYRAASRSPCSPAKQWISAGCLWRSIAG